MSNKKRTGSTTLTSIAKDLALFLNKKIITITTTKVTSIHGSAGAVVPLPPNRIDLVNVDDAGRALFRLLEQVAHARRAQSTNHLDELGPVHGKEGHGGLVGHGLGQHGLAAARRAQHQHALRHTRTIITV